MDTLITGIVATLLFVSIGWWLTREKNEAAPVINRLPFPHPHRDAMAPAARTIQAQSSPETDIKWGWIIAVVLILAVVYPPLAIFAGLGAIPASG
jgi:hypothetical protein